MSVKSYQIFAYSCNVIGPFYMASTNNYYAHITI